MRLDRYSGNSIGKYSIIEHQHGDRVTHINDPMEDFFVIKLKNINSPAALVAYATEAAKNGDLELSKDVFQLSKSAGINHPHCKMPD
jgi:hypothetical protein